MPSVKSVNTDVEMGRISVQLPLETLEQIDQWAIQAGVKRGQFASMALALGARSLARQFVPETFMTPDAWRQVAEAMGVDAEKMEQLLTSQKKES